MPVLRSLDAYVGDKVVLHAPAAAPRAPGPPAPRACPVAEAPPSAPDPATAGELAKARALVVFADEALGVPFARNAFAGLLERRRARLCELARGRRAAGGGAAADLGATIADLDAALGRLAQ